MTTRAVWIETTCGCGCGVTFQQLRDPGKEREYLNNAHKQRAYRARNPHKSHSGTRRESARARQAREEREAWAYEQARKEQERQRKARRDARDPKVGRAPSWTFQTHGDDEATAKRRRTCRLLYERATHPTTPEHEATACRERADMIGKKYGFV
jgi:hypothetical protein